MRFRLVKYAIDFKLDYEARKICENIVEIFDRSDNILKNYKEYKEYNDCLNLSDDEFKAKLDMEKELLATKKFTFLEFMGGLY